MPAGMVRPRASQNPQALRDGTAGPAGIWLGASELLRRPVPVDELYPHICGQRVPSGARLHGRDCAACAWERQQKAEVREPPPVPDEVRAAEARRLGERE